MANIIMWHQGSGGNRTVPDCGGGPNLTCPESKRIAAEYARSFFTLTNVLNPNWDDSYYGRENWQQKLVEQVAVGDTIWFVLVPPKHTLYDVAAFGEDTYAAGSTLTSLAGLKADLVTAKFAEAAGTTLCEPTELKTQASVAFPSGANPDEVFVSKKVEMTTSPKEWLGVGLKITAMPTGTTTLENIRAKLAVVAHAFGYDAQTHM